VTTRETATRDEGDPQGAASWELQSIFHFTVSASDFERSLDFYQRLGFELLRDNRDVVWPQFVADNFGMRRAQGRGALLGLDAAPTQVRIDLIEWLEPRDLPAAERPSSDERPPRIVAIRTRNVVAAYEALRARGIEFVREPFHPDPKLGVEAVVCCTDPDGLIIELIEYKPGVLGSRVESLETR
jgi:catechol 2,3-dioxygenase-like lactoylglutathione lyase family enzyme